MTSIAAPQLASELASLASSTSAEPVQLQLGQVLSGTVIALLNNAMLRLQTPAGLLDLAADTPLPAGTSVAITVQGTAQQPRIVITPVAGGSRQPLPPQANEAGSTQITADRAATNSATAVPPSSATANEAESANPQSAPTSAAPSSTQTALATAAARLTPTSTQPGTPQAVTPQTAITRAALSTATAIVRDAATSQGSLAALYADLDAAVRAPSTPLPPPILDAARLVLAMRLNVASSQNVSADDVSAALARAGVASAAPPTEVSTRDATAPDLGTALTALRQVLKTWVDQQPDTRSASELPDAPALQTAARINVSTQPYRGAVNLPQPPALVLLAATAPEREQINRVLLQPNPDVKTTPELPNAAPPQIAARSNASNPPIPPYRGAPDVPQAPAPASLSSTAPPREQAIHLLAQTDAAIARQTLLRIVSLPGDPASTGNTQHNNDNATRVMFEIPIVTAQGTGVAPMTIARDRDSASAVEGLKSWLVRFSIDLPEIGPVHARIALTGERTTVTLNAERADSAELLAAGLPLLDAGLRSVELEPGELRCRTGGSDGNRAGAARSQPAAPGMFVDQAS
jgi:hypothetical protein